MPALPKISVITPSFNSIRTIRETIESVRQQDYPNLEHIVMDGGSKDGTAELLKEYPHLHFDTSATKWVVREVSPRRDAFRNLVTRYPGRFLFGSDLHMS